MVYDKLSNLKSKLLDSKLGQIFQYSLIKYVALAFGFLKNLLNAQVLGPELLGVLGNLLLVLSYCGYCNLGIVYSMNSEYVIYGDEDKEKSKQVLDTSFTFITYLSGLFILASIVSFLYYRNDYGVYLAIIFVIAIFEQFRMYYINYFRLKDDLRSINKLEIINNVVVFFITYLLIRRIKVYGILFAMIICSVATMTFGLIKSEKIKITINKTILKNLIRVGIPLLIYNLGFYILTTIDRLVIIKFYSDKELGYYTFSDSMVKATLVFITSLLFLIYPKVLKVFKEGENKEIIKSVNDYTKLLELASSVLVVVGITLFEPFIRIFFSQYNNAIGVYIILLLAVVINNISYFANVYLVSNYKQRYLVYLQCIAIVLNLCLNLLFVKIGKGIIGVAFATMITNCIYSLLQYSFFLKETSKQCNIIYLFKIFNKICLYVILVSCVVMISNNYYVYTGISILLTIVFYLKSLVNVKGHIKDIFNRKLG